MYPNGELNELAAQKFALRRRIQVRRAECAIAAEGAARPIEWLDRAIATWRKISPLTKVAAVPLAMLLKRTLFRRAKILGSLLRWGPLAFRVFRSAQTARR
jgi:hypothetical protein